MFGNSLRISFNIFFDDIQWIPNISCVWGEATHFVHKNLTAEEIKANKMPEDEGIPLNKEYELDICWLWFYFVISLSFDRSENA